MKVFYLIIKLLLIILPWKLHRIVLIKFFKYEIHPSARIGLSWVYPQKLIMHENSFIDHFTIIIHLDSLEIRQNSMIGRSNWITGLSTYTPSKHFKHQSDRKSQLFIDCDSAITKKHHIDCTNSIRIGKFVTIAGYNSQLLTHSINLSENYQDSKEIIIGDYTLIGTNVVILGGSILPSYSVLAAKSLLNKAFYDQWTIYGGVPAKHIGNISPNSKYFSRTTGFVN